MQALKTVNQNASREELGRQKEAEPSSSQMAWDTVGADTVGYDKSELTHVLHQSRFGGLVGRLVGPCVTCSAAGRALLVTRTFFDQPTAHGKAEQYGIARRRVIGTMLGVASINTFTKMVLRLRFQACIIQSP